MTPDSNADPNAEPKPGAEAKPDAKTAKGPEGYFYGRRGGYASAIVEHQATGKGLRFGDRVEYAPAVFKTLPKALKECLIPEKDWPAHVKALKADGQLKQSAAVPGVQQ